VTIAKKKEFWNKTFGNQYVDRKNSKTLLESNVIFFKNTLSKISGITGCLELRPYFGLNLLVIRIFHFS
jgi:hypothetical protein